MKQTLLINAHPDKESFNYALSQAYQDGAQESGNDIALLNLANLSFDLNLEFGYRKKKELEPDLVDALDKIKKADHLVWVFPVWWYSYPALMKGFIDRTFLPGITYQPVEGKPFPQKLLKGKTARLIITADTPGWYDYLFMKRPAINQFKKGTLEYCGIRPVKVTYIAPIKNSSLAFRNKWKKKVSFLGKELQ